MNLVLCCSDCNNLKGALTGREFKAFLDGMHTFHPEAQRDIFRRLRTGAMGARLRFFKKSTTSSKPVSRKFF
jgi:hypothetical protein